MLALLPTMARAEDKLAVVVRAGPHDATIVTRLRGQLADLEDVTLAFEPVGETVEPTLEAQLAAADKLSTSRDARVVVWFVARGKTLAVAIATPRDHRLFVREVPQSSDSATAEAAAITVRTAVRSIALGGTIGVEVPREPVPVPVPPEPEPVPVPARAQRWTIAAALGWQAARDGGADRGAHALVQRTTVARGVWGASLTLSLGVPLAWRASPELALDVSRSGAIVGGERRLGGGIALGVGVGAVVYHRATSTAPSDLSPTPSASTVAAAAALELTWRARIAAGVRLLAGAALDVVAGAPVAAIDRDGMVEDLDTVSAAQLRGFLAIEVGPW